jgi:hypothetical protein
MMSHSGAVGLVIPDVGEKGLDERMFQDVDILIHGAASLKQRRRACNRSAHRIQTATVSLPVEEFRREIESALRHYEKFIICVEKTPEDFLQSLRSLMEKAITAYETRGEGMRHGIALDKHVTIILSQTDGARPMCGIYFNLHSPYRKAKA